MNIINVEHLYKIYGEKIIFDDASFGIQKGDKIGIVGINGTGKSTLLKMIAGEETPDKGRTNIILSRDPEWTVRGATVVHSIKELMEVLKPYEDDDIYVAGGGEIYRQLLPYCDTAYVTRIDMTYQADTFFEDLDESPDWEMVEEGDEQTCFDIEFYFTEYRRKNEKAERQR